jgi:hypothetical protein
VPGIKIGEKERETAAGVERRQAALELSIAPLRFIVPEYTRSFSLHYRISGKAAPWNARTLDPTVAAGARARRCSTGTKDRFRVL